MQSIPLVCFEIIVPKLCGDVLKLDSDVRTTNRDMVTLAMKEKKSSLVHKYSMKKIKTDRFVLLEIVKMII